MKTCRECRSEALLPIAILPGLGLPRTATLTQKTTRDFKARDEPQPILQSAHMTAEY